MLFGFKVGGQSRHQELTARNAPRFAHERIHGGTREHREQGGLPRGLYTLLMLERATVKLTPITARTADLAPVVPACCNVCRTCTTTNMIGLSMAMVAGAGYGIARFAKRVTGRR